MAIDQEKLKARRERQNLARKLARAGKQIIASIPIIIDVLKKAGEFDKRRRQIDAHNAELHKTSAYFAEQARSAERAMERKRWSHTL